MRKRAIRKTHAYSAQRSGSKKYPKVERRRRRKPRWTIHNCQHQASI